MGSTHGANPVPDSHNEAPKKEADASELAQGLPGVAAPAAGPTALKTTTGIIKAPAPTVDIEKLEIAPSPGRMKLISPPPPGKIPTNHRIEQVFESSELIKGEGAVATLGGAARRLLPETVTEENSEDKGAPLLNDNDQRCYSARFSDLKGANALTHYATVGVAQGRLGTCAKSLTDYEAETYLETFPDLSQKFGRDTKSSWEQARKHYSEVGYLNTHYSSAMKADSKQTTWECKHNTQCKCHGTLWFGSAKRLDDKKPIAKFEDFRLFKTISKDTSDSNWTACSAQIFGSDPHAGKPKTCFCEDKPLYVPNYCADDGDDCVCSGYVTYGRKLNAAKKDLTFKEHISAGSFTVAEVKEGLKSLSCSADSFGGVDPSPEEKDETKGCFCDNRKKMFNSESLKSIEELWKSRAEISSSTTSVTSTTKVLEEVKTEIKTKTEEWTQSVEVQETERKVATEALEAQKKCVLAAKESAKRYKSEQIRKKYLQRKKLIEAQRQKLAKWRATISVKHSTAVSNCGLAQRAKNPAEKARLIEECTRLKEEVDTSTTDNNIETAKIDEQEKKVAEEEAKDSGDADGKGEDEEVEVVNTTEQKKAEIEEETTETEEQVIIEKVDINQKKIEILKFQEKTQNQIAVALRKKRSAILKIIKLENKRLAKLTREEESTVDSEDGEDGAKATVSSKVTARAEAAITASTTRISGYKTKIVYLVTKISTSTTKVVTLREKVTKLKTLIDAKTAELLEVTKTLRAKQEFLEKNPSVSTTQTQISELKIEITTIEKLVKTTRKEYVEVYAESLSLQKLIDFFTSQKKEYEEEIKDSEEEIEENKAIITEQEEKAKIEATVKTVTSAQKLAFATHQKVVEVEEELSEAKKTKEEKLATLKAEKDEEEKKLKVQKEELKKYEDQKTQLEGTLKSTTSKSEKSRITKEISSITEWITKTTTILEKIEKKITVITTTITTITSTGTTTITELTTKLTTIKATSEKDDLAASKAINTLPGTPGETIKITGGIQEKTSTTESNVFGSRNWKKNTSKTSTTATTTTSTASVAGPTAGITDIATTVVKVTEEAKKKRQQCARATKRLTNQKDIIAKYIEDLKEEIAENKKLVEECRLRLKDEQLEYAKTQADANAIAAKDPTKFQELTLKLKALQLQLDNQGKKCNEDEENVEEQFKKIQGKNDEVGELVKFVQTACAEAGQSEEEVAATVQIITQIEVVNRLYNIYIKSVQALGQNEKLWESQKATYDRERTRISSELAEIKRRIQVATSTISTLEEQVKTVTASKSATTTTVTEQVTRIKLLITQQEVIIKTETAEQGKTEKSLEELMASWKKTMTSTQKLKRDLKRSQESYEDAQRRLRKEVDVKTKIDDYRAKVLTGKKTLEQKFTQITKIMIQIKEEIESHKKRAGALTEQVEECSKRTTIARTTITTLTSKQNTLESSTKSLKGADLSKVKSALEKLGDELENAKNQLQQGEGQCTSLKDEITKITTSVVAFEQEFKYYTSILETVKKEIEEAEKNQIKKADEDEEKEEKKDEKKDDKEEKTEEKEEKKEAKEPAVVKEKITTSSTTNEVKQIEEQTVTTTSTIETLEKELEKTETDLTAKTEEIAETSKVITIDEGEQSDEKKELEKVTRRKIRQKCATMFPAVFTQFAKQKSARASGMCPCQGTTTGVSQVSLAIDAPEDADKVVQQLFQKKLASEAKFLMQVQRTALGADNKLVVEGEKNAMTLVILTSDDKVSNVLTELEEADIAKKGEAIVSPLLGGKRAYMKWVQESLNSVKASASVSLLDTGAL